MRTNCIVVAFTVACCVVITTTTTTVAQDKPPLQRLERGVKVAPKRIAGLNAQGERVTPWYEYAGGDERPAGMDLIFDCYFNEECEDDGYWYYGTAFVNPFIANDMTPEPNDGWIDGIQFIWYWGQDTQCVINVFTGSEFSVDCAAEFGDILGGAALDFGFLDGDTGFPYFIDPVDLEGVGLSIPIGETYFLQLTDGTNLATGSGTQFLLWGTGPNRPGEQGPFQYDDRNFDEEFAPHECNDYGIFGLCPDPLGAAFAAYGTAMGDGQIDLHVSGDCPGTVTVSWAGAPANRTLGLIKAECTGGFVIPGGACAGTQLGLCDSGIQLVAQFPSGNGSGRRAGNAPPSACGDRVQLIAAPDCVPSDVERIN